MSYLKQTSKKINFSNLREAKSGGHKFSMVTCYDYTFAKLVDRTSVDFILVGDSLGNVMLGHSNTLSVTLDHMIHHCSSVVLGAPSKLIIIDMPFMTNGISIESTADNVKRLIGEGHAHAIKIEGVGHRLKEITRIVELGVPVVGHLGLMPQQVHKAGGYKLQGRSESQAQEILDEAKQLESAGASMIVLEMVYAELAQEITSSLSIPVIGIGAGPHCDGQVLVLQDLLGMNLDFSPKFLKKYAELGQQIISSVDQFCDEVKSGQFPSTEHTYKKDSK